MKVDEAQSRALSPAFVAAARLPPHLRCRKRRVRGLWQRTGSFVARLNTETPDGRRKLVWHVLPEAKTVAEARRAMATLDLERRQGSLVARGEAPHFTEFLERYFVGPLSTKRTATQGKERSHALGRSQGRWRPDREGLRPHRQ